MPRGRNGRFVRQQMMQGRRRWSGNQPFQYIPPWVAREIQTLATPAGYIYVAPTSTGIGNGSNWENATTLNSVSTLITQAKAQNKRILLLNSAGDHHPTVSQILTNTSGTSRDQPVVFQGVDATGVPGIATVTGDRAPIFSPGQPNGSPWLRMRGTQFITFSNVLFNAWGDGALQFNNDIVSDIGLLDCGAQNCYRLIENVASGGPTASVSRITVRRLVGNAPGGFERGLSRFQYDSNNVFYEMASADGNQQIDDLFAAGLTASGTAHNFIYRGVVAGNFQVSPLTDPSLYWNGDAFSTERGNYNFMFDSCAGYGNTDAGIDIKGTNHYVRNCRLWDNKNNSRSWGDAIHEGTQSLNPFKRGGTGDQSHYNIPQDTTPNVHIFASLAYDTNPASTVYHVQDSTLIASIYNNITTSGTLEHIEGTGTITYQSPLPPPSITSGQQHSITETTPFSITLTADQPVLYWEIVGGADYGLFTMDGWFIGRGGILTLPPQNFDAPTDANGNNVYDVQVQAVGLAGARSVTQTISVSVTSIGFKGPNIYEGDYFELPLGAVCSFDGNGKAVPADIIYTLLPGFDSALFNISFMAAGSDVGTITNVLKMPSQPAGTYTAYWQSESTSTGQITTGFTQVRVLPLVVGTTKRYIGFASRGTGDGTSFANQTTPLNLNTMIGQVGPGGTVYIAADQGTYAGVSFAGTTITNGGGPGSGLITICGVKSDGSLTPTNVPILGTRTTFVPPPDPNTPTSIAGWTAGGDTIKLGDGANNLKFLNFAPTSVGNFLHAVGSFHGLTVDTVNCFNSRLWFEQEHQLCTSGLNFVDVAANGFSKQGVRCRGASYNWNLLRVDMNSMRQDGDNFAVCYQVTDYANNITLDTCTGLNTYSSSGGAFKNGDGFSAEGANYNISLINSQFSGNMDGGIDTKAENTVLDHVTNESNRANLKVWYGQYFLTSFISKNPLRRLGTGGQDHIDGQCSSDQVTRIWIDSGCQFIDTDATTNVFFAENGSYPPLAAVHYHVDPGATVSSAGTLFLAPFPAVGSTIDDFTTNPPVDIIGIASATVASGNLVFIEPNANNVPSPQIPASGDLIVAKITYRDTPAFTLPAGWTLVPNAQTSGNATNGVNAIASSFMAYILRGSSTPSLSFLRTLGGKAYGDITYYRKYDGTPLVLDVYNSSTQVANTTTPVCPQIIPTGTPSLIVGLVGSGRNSTASAFAAVTDPSTASGAVSAWDYPYPGKFFQRTSLTSGGTTEVSQASFDALRAAAGATGQFSATAAVSNRQTVLVAAFK